MCTTTPYQQLIELTSSGKAEIVHVIGPPRSNGTALHLALAQRATGQINEPFYYPDFKGRKWSYVASPTDQVRTFDDGCDYILQRYKKEAVSKTSGPVTLVVHDLSPDLTEKEFENLLKFNSHLVFAIRDPRKQALSMLTRYVNDKISELGGNKLKTADVVQLMADGNKFHIYVNENPDKVSLPMIYNLLGKKEEDSKRSHEVDTKISIDDCEIVREKILKIVSEEFSISWDNLYRFFQLTQTNFTKHPHSIFDAASLFNNPEKNLMELTKRIKIIKYHPDMVHNWTKFTGVNFDCVITRKWGSLAQTNAWNGPVRNSDKIVLQKGNLSEPVPLESFPPEFREVIKRQELPYERMILESTITTSRRCTQPKSYRQFLLILPIVVAIAVVVFQGLINVSRTP